MKIFLDAILNIGIALSIILFILGVAVGFTWLVTTIPYLGFCLFAIVILFGLYVLGDFVREGFW